MASSLGNDASELSEQAADLIVLGGMLALKPLVRPLQAAQGEAHRLISRGSRSAPATAPQLLRDQVRHLAAERRSVGPQVGVELIENALDLLALVVQRRQFQRRCRPRIQDVGHLSCVRLTQLSFHHSPRNSAIRSVVQLATHAPRKSASSVQTGQPSTIAHANTVQFSDTRAQHRVDQNVGI